MIDGVPNDDEWERMSVEDVQRWAHDLRTWKQTMRQDTTAGRTIRRSLEREQRRVAAHPASVALEDYR